MPTELPFEAHLRTIATEGALLAELVDLVDPDAPVPTCPEWTVRDLVAHQGEVHRWATDVVTGQWDQLSPSDQADRVAAPLGPTLASWFQDGVDDLVTALDAAAPDLHTAVFLLDAPPPRLFWARRQANETTMHRVDLLSAQLGRPPAAAETGIDAERAIDGIDELLHGFVPRRRSKLRSSDPFTLAIEVTGTDRRFALRVSDDPVVTVESERAADATFSGDPVPVYLGLWNRGDELTVTGDQSVLTRWRELVRVQWH